MSKDFRVRLSRVRLKEGADVHVLHNRGGADGDVDWRGTIVRNARAVAEMGDECNPLVGYLLIGFFGDGATSTGYRIDDDRITIPRALMPAWISEIVRRELVTRPEARGVFGEMFERV